MDILMTPVIAMIGWQEGLLIGAIIIFLFGGAKKIPELMKGLGSGIKEFKNAAKEIQEPIDEAKTAAKEAVDSATSDS